MEYIWKIKKNKNKLIRRSGIEYKPNKSLLKRQKKGIRFDIKNFINCVNINQIVFVFEYCGPDFWMKKKDSQNIVISQAFHDKNKLNFLF